MTQKLSKRQSILVSSSIQKEARLRKRAFRKRFSGLKLTPREQRAIKRTKEQIVRIGFEKARQKDPNIPLFTGTARRVR